MEAGIVIGFIVLMILGLWAHFYKGPWHDVEVWLHQAADILLDRVMPLTNKRRPRISIKIKENLGRAGFWWDRKDVLGECRPRNSAGVNEIYILARLPSHVAFLETLLHELIHALDNGRSNHSGHFAKVAGLVGLTGELWKSRAGPSLARELEQIADILGPIPPKRQ